MKVWAMRLSLMLAAAVLALVVAEAAIRTFDLGPYFSPVVAGQLRLSDNPRLVYELVPNTTDKTGQRTSVNSDSMRDRDYDLRKPPGATRIACIGDSICLGWGVHQDDVFSEVMEQELQTAGGPPVEVLNFGVVGYNAGQIVENLRSKALKYDPDVVVYAYCLNDPQDYSFEDARIRAQLSRAQNQLWGDLHDTARRGLSRSRLFLLTRFALQSVLSREQAGSPAPQQRDDPQFDAIANNRYDFYFNELHHGESWRKTGQAMDELARITRSADITCLIAIFPLMVDLPDYRLQPVHDQVARAARERGFLVVDLLSAFQGLQAELPTSERFSIGPIHPAEAGHRLAADRIREALIEHGSLEMPVSAGPPRK